MFSVAGRGCGDEGSKTIDASSRHISDVADLSSVGQTLNVAVESFALATAQAHILDLQANMKVVKKDLVRIPLIFRRLMSLCRMRWSRTRSPK